MVLFIGFVLQLVAQKKESKPKKYELDSNYVRIYPKYVTLSMYTLTPVMRINISPLTDTLLKYSSYYEGNFSGSLGFGVDYKALSISYGFNVPLDTNKIATKGKSMAYVLKAKVKMNPYILSADYRRYIGYYDSNPRIYNKDLSDSIIFFKRPDIKYKHYGVGLIYNPRCRRYSYTAPLTYTNRQMKTNHGFMLKTNITYVKLMADSSLVSTLKKNYFPDFYGVYRLNALVAKSGGGYGLNLVIFKRAYFAFSWFLMCNYLRYHYEHIDHGRSLWRGNVNVFTEGNIAIGFNAERFYIGIRSSGDSNAMRVEGAKINITYGAIYFDLGYRFDAPKWLEKGWEKTATKYLKL
ncbi:MAG: DUF4421 domain-containing protein [Cytophagaceae bacterium]|nr:DUF4421 domain-containing protein [Cytophagaceae bacterium]MDW8456838.1 DUF4421 family protein [Cytophagaceae bacterium]